MIDLRQRLYIATFQQDAVRVAAEYGLGLEINHTCISEDLDSRRRDELIAAIRRDLKEVYGAESAVYSAQAPLLHGPFTEIYPAAIDYRARDMARLRLEEAYQVCLAVGARRMIVHSGWLPFIYFKDWQAEKGAAFWLDFMADKPSDFEIMVENVLEDEPDMLAAFMAKAADPRIRLCLDVGHANAACAGDSVIAGDAACAGDDAIRRWIELLGPFIGHFHLHNNDGRSDSHSAFDEGTLDMASILAAAERCCRPDTTFTIEARDCRSCAEWLRNRGYI